MNVQLKKRSLTGLWNNQNGSELELHVDENGKLSGVFRPSECCNNHALGSHPVVGWQVNDTFAFSVMFAEKESVTAWVGQVNAEGHMIASWQMSIDAHMDAGKFWRCTWTGQDVFREGKRLTPQAVPTDRSAKSHPFYCDLI